MYVFFQVKNHINVPGTDVRGNSPDLTNLPGISENTPAKNPSAVIYVKDHSVDQITCHYT